MKIAEIKKEILLMAWEDQAMRMSQGKKQKTGFSLDKRHTLRLQEIIESIGWPTISLVGEEASYGAWLIVQHADHNVVFQERCLELMRQAKADVLPLCVAYLTDRVAVNRGKKQIFGTQFHVNEKNELLPQPIDNMKLLEQNRKEMGLEPFSVYSQKMKQEFIYPDSYETPMVGSLYKAS